ncbi:MAG: 5'-nucleotidase [Candidatus Bathyarchaeia archaeon]
MPTEIIDAEKFVRLSEGAVECRVIRSKDSVKLKLRTPKKLYTLKVDEGQAEKLLKEVKCEATEI